MPKKLTDDQKENIDFLKSIGNSSRKIAEILNIGKSTVNDYLKVNKSKVIQTKKLPNILFLDVETAPAVAATFGRFDINLTDANIMTEGGQIICAAWKWLGETEVHSHCMTSMDAIMRDDIGPVWNLAQAINQADIIVGHNIKRFDWPVIKGRMLVNELPAPKNVKVVDTLTMARTMKFPSNKLDGLCKHLDLDRKVSHAGISLWVSCMQGDQFALDKMQEYNIQDVVILEQLYLKLAPWYNQLPNVSAYFEEMRCNACGSINVEATGDTVVANVKTYAEYVCADCGKRHKLQGSKLVN